MGEIQYLREQAARAERLASPALDRLTVERLLAMSKDYREMALQLERTLGATSLGELALPH